MNSLLIQNQVAPKRLSTLYFGESQPRAANKAPQGRQLNRRVELKISPNSQIASN
jgi:outer membrane protein OmpA-like peptidoglycan-associated protein